MTYRLHLERWGRNGPSLVLVHGLGASGRYWRWVAEFLQGEFRVFAPDLLGFGRSPWPNIAYTVNDHLDALDATLKAEGIEDEPPVLAGHSLGTILALAWAARYPKRFGGLVLMGLPCYRSPEEARAHVAGLGPLAHATVARPRLGAAICGLMCFGRPFWRRVVPALMPDVPADVARDGVLHTWGSYSRTLQHGILDVDVRTLAGQVGATGLPTQLLHGDLDREAPLEGASGLARSIGWSLEVLKGAGHGLPIERPQACAEAIRGQTAGSIREVGYTTGHVKLPRPTQRPIGEVK